MEATHPIEKYEAAADSFTDHPAIWGIDTGDEPSALDFPYYGRVIDFVNRRFPNQFAYLNLYPNYASVSQNSASQTVSQLGTASYAEHIEKYCENVGTDYICYDFYMYAASVAGAYENLRIVSDACLRTGRSMWIVLQVNSSRENEWTSENRLRFQAYSAMAFGAENIIWACYTAGWWHNQVLDKVGEKTEQYVKLKKVNAELACIGEEYMKYRRVSTHFIGFEKSIDLKVLNQKPVSELNTGIFFGVQAENSEDLIVGQLVSRSDDGSRALFICGADDPKDENPKEYLVKFRVGGDREVAAYSGTGEVKLSRGADGEYSFMLRSCSGVLVTASK
jgi:hypothetical protein